MKIHPQSSLPWWKIKRELIRPFRQLAGALGGAFTYFFGAWYFDKFLASKVSVITGKIQKKEKIAIYVIYTKNDLLQSHTIAINYLSGCGYSVVAVSNSLLSKKTIDGLIEICHQVIVRPNFGYDFGAYRQGILSLRQDLVKLEKLLLINDSTWFPVLDNNWLVQAEECKKDLVGAASNYGISRRIPADLREFSFDYTSNHKNFHYCSFALLLSSKILKSPDFLEFWLRFPLTNSKAKTVKRGEIGFSKWILFQGYSHCETVDVPNLKKHLSVLDQDELARIVQFLIVPEDRLLKGVRDQVLKTSKFSSLEEYRRSLTNIVLLVVARIGVAYATPYLNIRVRNSMFLKKSPMWLDVESRNTALDFINSLSQSVFQEAMLAEAIALGEKG